MVKDMGMMINRRRVYGGKKGLLPSGYTPVNYIQNPSDAFVLLPFYATNDTIIHTELIIDDTNNDYPYIMGTRTDKRYGGYYAIGYYETAIHFVFREHNEYYHIPGKNSRYSIDIKNGIIKVNNNEQTYALLPSFRSKNPFTLFRAANNVSGGAIGNYLFTGGIGYTEIFSNDFSCKLVPCIEDSINTCGFYDLVNQVFRGSSNSTKFRFIVE